MNKYSFTYGKKSNDYLRLIKNEEVFDKFQDNNLYHTYNPNIANEFKLDTAEKVMIKIIIEPFIQFLDKLIKLGADPKVKVGKLKRYREKDELLKKG